MTGRVKLAAVTCVLSIVPVWTPVASQSSPSPATGSIRGRVLDASGTPLADAEVGLMRFRQAPGPAERLTTRTTAMGEFAFEGLVSGRYRVIASKPGFATRPFQSSGPFDVGRDLELSAGEALVGIDIVLLQAGAIRGRVTDEDGQPVGDARVSAQWWRGEKLIGVQAPAITNAAGEYELSGLAAGEYFVMATASRMTALIGRRMPADFADYQRTWYPGVTAPTEAVPVRVAEAVATTGIDVQLSTETFLAVSGTLTDAEGSVPDGARLRYTQPRAGSESSGGTWLKFGPAGEFKLSRIAPGSLTLYGWAPSASGPLVDVTTLDIPESGAPSVRLVLRPGGRLAGRVEFLGCRRRLSGHSKCTRPLPG